MLRWCQQCVHCLPAVLFTSGETGVKLVQERDDLGGGGGVVLVVACDVLDTLTHEAGDVIPEVASNFSLYFVLNLDAFVQVHSGLNIGLSVYLFLFWNFFTLETKLVG